MPTLSELKTFSFHPKATVTGEMREWLEKLPAIEIITNILRHKLADKPSLENRVYFLQGRTGSGKSTLMISSLYKSLVREHMSRLYCSEPRVLLATSNAEEVARYNTDMLIGDEIGILTGTRKVFITGRGVVYATTQILTDRLYRILQHPDMNESLRMLRAMKIIVIDEIHVMDMPNLTLMRASFDILSKFGTNVECPLFIYTSATIDIDRLLRYYFPGTGIKLFTDPFITGYVSGAANFKVDEIFIPPADMIRLNKAEKVGLDQRQQNVGFEILSKYVYETILPKARESKSTIEVESAPVACRDILIFTPSKMGIRTIGTYLSKIIQDVPNMFITERMEITEVTQWRSAHRGELRVLIVGLARDYSPASTFLLSTSVDVDLDSRVNEIKIIVSTDIIEFGKTISTLYCAVDSGFNIRVISQPLSRDVNEVVPYIRSIPSTQNQTIQRLGRVGREAPGMFIHFYTKEVYDMFELTSPAQTVNETCLSNVLLQQSGGLPLYTPVSYALNNNYLYPISVDILIRSFSDLVKSGFITQIGEIVELVNQYRIKESHNFNIVAPWTLYAQYLHLVDGKPLWDALLACAINIKNIPNILTTTEITTKALPLVVTDVLKISPPLPETLAAIKDASNMFQSIISDESNVFPYDRSNLY